MTDSTLMEFRDPRTRLYSLTVGQYHKMIERGILPEGEPYELLRGAIVRKDRSSTGEDPMTVGHAHSWAVSAVEELNPLLRRLGCYARIQQPISLPPSDEPEPDGAIVRGRKEDYAQGHPRASDVLCVIEVADSSLRRDRTTKLGIYAAGKVQCYLIINLQERVIEEYTKPQTAAEEYAQVKTYECGENLTLPTAKGKGLVVAVAQFFPPAKTGRGARNGKHR